jgi:large subunit ribosomal protein L19
MTNLIQEFEKTQIKRTFPDIRPGDTVRVHQKIKEESMAKGKKGEKERVQIFEGVVLRVRGGMGLNGSFLVRKVASGVGVEKNFPIHMPSLVKVEVVKRGKVRQARLYYLRDKKEKDSRLKEIKLSHKDLENLKYEEKVEEPVKDKEEEKAEDKKKAGSKEKDNKKEKPQKKQEKTENKDSKKEKPKSEDKPKNKSEAKTEAKDNKKPKAQEKPKDKANNSKK